MSLGRSGWERGPDSSSCTSSSTRRGAASPMRSCRPATGGVAMLRLCGRLARPGGRGRLARPRRSHGLARRPRVRVGVATRARAVALRVRLAWRRAALRLCWALQAGANRVKRAAALWTRGRLARAGRRRQQLDMDARWLVLALSCCVARSLVVPARFDARRVRGCGAAHSRAASVRKGVVAAPAPRRCGGDATARRGVRPASVRLGVAASPGYALAATRVGGASRARWLARKAVESLGLSLVSLVAGAALGGLVCWLFALRERRRRDAECAAARETNGSRRRRVASTTDHWAVVLIGSRRLGRRRRRRGSSID